MKLVAVVWEDDAARQDFKVSQNALYSLKKAL
jgi:hypothetical protein